MSILQLLDGNGYIESGSVMFDGRELTKLSINEMYKVRGNDISVIFQEPMTSLNPVFTVEKQVSEPFIIHQGMSKKEAAAKVVEMLSDVKLIADEPTTALDVTIQAQILRLMNELKKEFGTSILFITHDLGVINQMADDVAVMYCGQIVEMSPVRNIFAGSDFMHPYTEGLLRSIPRLDAASDERLESIPGAVPHPLNLPKGCKFAPRCKYCTERCLQEEPQLTAVSDEQQIRCFYPDRRERHATR